MQAAPTIIAIASPPGRSLRGIVRISGHRTFDLLESCLKDFDSALRATQQARAVRLKLGPEELPALLIPFRSPHSYTGEDAAELQAPGNPALLERIVAEILNRARGRQIDARLAEPGEFTARAFLNHRLTLTQAEGVAAAIAARSDAELRAAKFLLSGALGAFAHQAADDLASALALVEAGIDFTDQDDVVAISPRDLQRRLIDLRERVAQRLAHAVGVEQLQAIPWVVLVGEPNAGKSSLFNALLGHERAVVSPISGTTRDVLAEPLTISTSTGPGEVMLVDLAGLDDDESVLNQSMQAMARDAMERAELVIRCTPADQESDSHDSSELLVRTKCDLLFDQRTQLAGMPVSVVTGNGLQRLRHAIADRLAQRAVSLAADAAALRPRHEQALRSALLALHEAIELVASQDARTLGQPELIASAMRSALNDMGALAGEITPDEVLGRVFASFCIGK